MNFQNQYIPNMYQQPYVQNQYNPNVFNQQIPQQGINGKFVNDFGNVNANDVPMNGQAAIFPLMDLSKIEVRKWNSDGTISRTLYEPIQEPENTFMKTSTSNDVKSLESAFMNVTEPLKERLDRIEEMLKSKPTRSRKESTDES